MHNYSYLGEKYLNSTCKMDEEVDLPYQAFEISNYEHFNIGMIRLEWRAV
jgi:hypothetical protein